MAPFYALLNASQDIRDAAAVLIIASFLIGALAVVVYGWKRLRAPSLEATLREHLRDSDAQVRGLLEQNDRLARMLVAGDREGAGWASKGNNYA